MKKYNGSVGAWHAMPNESQNPQTTFMNLKII
jgi:hypothetical protein